MKTQFLLLLALGPIVPNLAPAQTISPSVLLTQGANSRPGGHISAKDDLSRIGHRRVGHTGFGNWYSIDREISLGKEYSALVEASLKLVDDPAVTEYVNRIGQLLVKNSDAQVPFTIKVVDSDELNAFTLPGGYLYVNYGVILIAEDEAELAGVMAHEVAHVASRHATRQMTRANMLNLMSLPLAMTGGGIIGEAIHLVVDVAKPMEMLKFSRTFETEADYLGLEYLYAAGYDPQAFISFLERAGAQEKSPGKWGALLSTHPLTTSRIKKSQVEIAKILPGRESYIVNTSQFDEVKAHLLAMRESQRADTPREADEPKLRRGSPGPSINRD
jgi:predicted Zn-dependent protease